MPDSRIPLGAREKDLAMAALREFTDMTTIGPFLGSEDEGEMTAAHFAYTGRGYPGWHWEVLLTRPAGQEQPTVVEMGLLPTAGALLAPEWVPWSERLADYRAQQDESQGVDPESPDDLGSAEDDPGEADDAQESDETDDIDEDDLQPDDTQLPDLDVDEEDDAEAERDLRDAPTRS